MKRLNPQRRICARSRLTTSLQTSKNVIDAGHCKVIELTEAERDSFKAAAQPMIDKYTESNPNVKKIITLTEEFRAQNS